MRRHELLAELHRLLVPRSYLEIGVHVGSSLTLSRTRSIGIDPYYSLEREILCDVHLVRTSSDEFFAREHPLAHFDEPLVDLAFIDGMHLAEYAFRDFVNVERFAHPGTVVVIDDMLPRDVPQARRDRGSSSNNLWTGDVYKILPTLRELRPDLVCLEVDTTPTGTVVVLNPDPTSTVLLEAADEVVESYVRAADPQDVPPEVLDRRRAHDPRALLDLPLWGGLVAARTDDGGADRAQVESAVAGLVPVA